MAVSLKRPPSAGRLNQSELLDGVSTLYGSLGRGWQTWLARDLGAAGDHEISQAAISLWALEKNKQIPRWVTVALYKALREAERDLHERALACGRLSEKILLEKLNELSVLDISIKPR